MNVCYRLESKFLIKKRGVLKTTSKQGRLITFYYLQQLPGIQPVIPMLILLPTKQKTIVIGNDLSMHNKSGEHLILKIQ
jgi:hypothetical protein